jgi:hypothetical protein
MKVVLPVYKGEYANTDIEIAWLDLDRSSVELLLSHGRVFDELRGRLGSDLSTLTFVSDLPRFIKPWDDEEDPFFVLADGNELTIYGFEEAFTVLRDDQTYPPDAAQKMVITWLNVEKDGVWWEARDNYTDDKVETSLIKWESLTWMKSQLEGRDGL